MTPGNPPVVCIIGRKNAGKTELTIALVTDLDDPQTPFPVFDLRDRGFVSQLTTLLEGQYLLPCSGREEGTT